MSEKFYITTPIYYVNDVPHIGSAYTTLAADVQARFRRLCGQEVFFLTGTDEHGQKVAEAAEARGKTPQQYVDEISQTFRALLPAIGATNDDFIRTTEPRHEAVVKKLFAKLIEQGDVYKSTYRGMYCKPCETFFPSNQVGEDGCCPDCGRKLVEMEEENYFLRTSAYQEKLLKFYEEHPDAIAPASRYNEVVSFIKSGLKDQCVSRASVPWAIPVPGDEEQTIYVWVDALINYLSALGDPDDEKVKQWWASAHHLVGKDIIRFHCVIWPILLMALGFEPPQKVFAHGWWTVEGEKMSKSKGNVVNPFEMVELYGRDAFRYFLFRQMPFGVDGDYSERALVMKANSDLANDLGNLLSRTVAMAEKYQGGKVTAKTSLDVLDIELRALTHAAHGAFDAKMREFNFEGALKELWSLLGRANKYIDETMPWKLAEQSERLNEVLFTLCEVLRLASIAVAPFMPEAAEKMRLQLGLAPLADGDWAQWRWGQDYQVQKGDALFPRIDLKVWEKEKAARDAARKAKLTQPKEEKQGEKKEKSQEDPNAPCPQITIDQFAACELRVAEIREVELVEGADRLYKLTVDLGFEQRTIVSSIRQIFSPDELKGRQIILLCNLKPAKMRGVVSNGMLLAGGYQQDGKEVLGLLEPHIKLPLGTRIH